MNPFPHAYRALVILSATKDLLLPFALPLAPSPSKEGGRRKMGIPSQSVWNPTLLTQQILRRNAPQNDKALAGRPERSEGSAVALLSK
jgi:hypothetical protein